MTASPGRRLRNAIAEKALVEAMAAHSPLSAALVEEAGFDAVWASGFELSALFGLADASLVSMTQHLDMTRAIAERTSLPVICDLDTGFGNAVNAYHAVECYERAGAAAVVIEDKSFPKMTSLVADGRQQLVRTAEFEGKIEAACAARRDPDFVVIARTEALIAGLGMEEALLRASAYAGAGADMVLVHSKQLTADEIQAFAHGWNGIVPLVIVPTAYPALGRAAIEEWGKVAIVIYGNHAIRAGVAAMRSAFAAIRRDGCAAGVEAQIATVEEIFALQNMAAIQRRETRFLR